MQETGPMKPAQPAQVAKGGKPAKPDVPKGDKRAASVANLQYVLDRACNMIHDSKTASYAVRARRAAKNGVPRATIDKGLEALAGALADARAEVEKAYSAPEPKTAQKPVSRVSLGV